MKTCHIAITVLMCILSGCNSKKYEDQNEKITKNQGSIAIPKMTLCNPKIRTAISDYITYTSGKSELPKVYQVFIENYYLELSFKILPIRYYSELLESLPTSYTIVDNKVVLFHTGLEKLLKPDSNWFKRLKAVIGDDLENNLLNDSTINTNFIPSFLYHSEVWEIRVKGDSVAINKHAPYPEIIPLPPIRKIRKFFPPKKKRN